MNKETTPKFTYEISGLFSCSVCNYKSDVESKALIRLYLDEDFSIYRAVESIRGLADLDGLYQLQYSCEKCNQVSNFICLIYKGKSSVVSINDENEELTQALYCFYKYRDLFFEDRRVLQTTADRLLNMMQQGQLLDKKYLQNIFLQDIRLQNILKGFIGEKVTSGLVSRVVSVLTQVVKLQKSDLIKGVSSDMFPGIIHEDINTFIHEFNSELAVNDFVVKLREMLKHKEV